MGCYFTLWYNIYAFSLLFSKIYMKRENAGNWNSGPQRSKSERPIRHNSKCPKTLQRIIWNIKKLGEENTRGDPPGGHKPEGRAPTACGPPGRPSVPIFCYMMCLDLVKIKRKLSRRSAAVSRWNLGRSNLGLRRSCSVTPPV